VRVLVPLLNGQRPDGNKFSRGGKRIKGFGKIRGNRRGERERNRNKIK
jgi:hypothetical protein